MTPNPVEKQCLVNNQTITTAVLDLGPCTWASALSLATISNMIFSQQSSCHTPSLAHYCLQPATVTRDCSFPDTDHTRTNKLYIHLQDLIVIKPIQKRLDLARVTKNKGSHLNDLNHWLALAHCSPPRIFESRKPAQPNIHSSQLSASPRFSQFHFLWPVYILQSSPSLVWLSCNFLPHLFCSCAAAAGVTINAAND